MKVAMAAPDQARRAARLKERLQVRESRPRFLLEPVDRLRWKQIAVVAERARVVRNELGNRGKPWRGCDRLGMFMHGGDGKRELGA